MSCPQAPHSAQLGGARIAWAVQHPNSAELTGGFWTAEPVAEQDDETLVAGQRTSLYDWQPVDPAAPDAYDAAKTMRVPSKHDKSTQVSQVDILAEA